MSDNIIPFPGTDEPAEDESGGPVWLESEYSDPEAPQREFRAWLARMQRATFLYSKREQWERQQQTIGVEVDAAWLEIEGLYPGRKLQQ